MNGCKFLEKNKCKFIVIPCNTAHHWFLQKKINIPIISMPKEVFLFAKKNCKINAKIGILATEGTLKTKVYAKYFERKFSMTAPNHSLQEEVNFKIVKMGKIRQIEQLNLQ